MSGTRISELTTLAWFRGGGVYNRKCCDRKLTSSRDVADVGRALALCMQAPATTTNAKRLQGRIENSKTWGLAVCPNIRQSGTHEYC